jgi:protein-L-isoaspartate(D-aspartate) O-methyltransferase
MKATEDSYRHKGLRRQLVNQLKEKGISDERVLDAIFQVPRHLFLDTAFDKIAYEDRAFPIEEGQTISHPYTVAYQTQLLNVQPFQKVLEIGTGSCYQSCILSALGAQVFTIERQRKIYDYNKKFSLLNKYPQIKMFYGDGFEGLPTFAPFDKVIITAAAPFVPSKLIDQMKPGGIMVIPVNEEDRQRMLRITKKADGIIFEEKFDQFSFVPMLSGKNS